MATTLPNSALPRHLQTRLSLLNAPKAPTHAVQPKQSVSSSPLSKAFGENELKDHTSDWKIGVEVMGASPQRSSSISDNNLDLELDNLTKKAKELKKNIQDSQEKIRKINSQQQQNPALAKNQTQKKRLLLLRIRSNKGLLGTLKLQIETHKSLKESEKLLMRSDSTSSNASFRSSTRSSSSSTATQQNQTREINPQNKANRTRFLKKMIRGAGSLLRKTGRVFSMLKTEIQTQYQKIKLPSFLKKHPAKNYHKML